MNLPASTILVLIFAALAVAIFFIRALLRLGKKKDSPKVGQPKKLTPKQAKEKDEALEKFKKVHSAARDTRKKIAKEIDSDPNKATQALRSMMKR